MDEKKKHPGGRPKKGTPNKILKPIRVTDKLISRAWSTSNLTYKLLPHQWKLYDAIRESNDLVYVINCSRRFGKSTVLCIIALEDGLQHDDFQIKFAAPTAKSCKKIIHPILKRLVLDAPLEYRPYFKTQDSVYDFQNGSEIHVAGTDGGNADNLRGTSSNLNIIDEAGFCDDLSYVLDDILMPQTLTTDGRTIIASTPPRTVDHDYTRIAQEAMADGAYSHFTIYDNTSLSPEKIQKYKDQKGENSTSWKREYLAEFVVDEETQIIPEWFGQYEYILEEDEYRQFYHNYDSLDIGGSIDKTACLFSYYDFKKATINIVDELIYKPNVVTSATLAKDIKEKEEKRFGTYPVYKRIADNNNNILLNDLSSDHSLFFMPTSKDLLIAMVAEVRDWVKAGRIVVHPRCKELIACLRGAVWKKDRSNKVHHEFARSGNLGHYDALAALVYLIRNIDQHTNPIPANYQIDEKTHIFIGPTDPNKKKLQELTESMGFKPKTHK